MEKRLVFLALCVDELKEVVAAHHAAVTQNGRGLIGVHVRRV